MIPLGCPGDGPDPEPGTTCTDGQQVGNACAGVPAEQSIDTSACGALHEATADTIVAMLDGAASGDCVLLKPGKYASVTLPAGVSLYGESVDSVTVEGISVTAGTVAIERLTVDGAAVVVESGTANLDGVRISDSADNGLTVNAGAAASVTRSEILTPARYGVSAFDVDAIDIESSIIADAQGPGMWIQCTNGCGCADTVAASVQNSILRNNRIVGISIVGSSVTIENVMIADTTVGDSFEAGGGVSVSGCSVVEAAGLTVTRSADFGVLVDDSTMTMDGSTIEDNLRGMWIQSIGASRSDSVTVTNSMVMGNEGVGIGVDKQSLSVAIESSDIVDTRIVPLPVLVGGVSASVMDVGDGVSWLDGSQIQVTGVSVTNSARVGILIDGPVGSGSNIADLAMTAGDGGLGVLQQNLPADGEQPATSGTTPSIESDAAERVSIPSDIAIPPSI